MAYSLLNGTQNAAHSMKMGMNWGMARNKLLRFVKKFDTQLFAWKTIDWSTVWSHSPWKSKSLLVVTRRLRLSAVPSNELFSSCYIPVNEQCSLLLLHQSWNFLLCLCFSVVNFSFSSRWAISECISFALTSYYGQILLYSFSSSRIRVITI